MSVQNPVLDAVVLHPQINCVLVSAKEAHQSESPQVNPGRFINFLTSKVNKFNILRAIE